MVSVIMPVYNARKYIESTIESVLNQTFTDFELILIDDGATDGSGEVCDTYASMDKRIVLIHQANGGICKARNAGLAVAKGKYIAFCDHDDLYQPQYLELSVDAAEEKQADLVKFSYCSEFSQNGNVTRKTNETVPNTTYSIDYLIQYDYDLLNKTVRVLWNGLYKKQTIDKNRIKFDENIRAGMEDYLFNIHLLKNISRVVFIPPILFFHYSRLEQSTFEKYNEHRLSDIITTAHMESLWLNEYSVPATITIQHRSKYVSLMIRTLCHPECTLTEKEKIRWLCNLRGTDILSDKGIFLAIIQEFFSKPKIAVQDMLFTLGWNAILLFIWKLRTISKFKRMK